jgi:L-histidine N-alpha-methyltransferase
LLKQARTKSRLAFVQVGDGMQEESFLTAVARGLSQPQKSLPSRFFYDEAGSELFERITKLPEYYLTGAEQAILESLAPEIIRAAGTPLEIVEFGSGSSKKTRLLIAAALEQQDSLCYIPIDISGDFLKSSAESLLKDFPGLSVTAIAAEYFAGLSALPETTTPRLFLFMGSNIGNFTHEEAVHFLCALYHAMGDRDKVLIGIDRGKSGGLIEAAYNDEEGVTELFNKNLLRRINDELGGHFDLASFDHSAPFLPERGRVEMRLVSKKDQTVRVDALGRAFKFAKGEYIHTEDSHKYSELDFDSLIRQAHLSVVDCWSDAKEWFGLFLLTKGA